MAKVRYMVKDVEALVAFYTKYLDFAVKKQFGPAMAILTRDDLTLWVAGPGSANARRAQAWTRRLESLCDRGRRPR